MVVRVISYKLRGGQVQLSQAGGGFIMQTFGADKIATDVYDDKTSLLTSADFEGQKGGNVEDAGYAASTYARASYQARPMWTTGGEVVFSASEEHAAEFVGEEALGA